MADEEAPIFSAVSSSARQLFLILRCISFAAKTQLQISEEGLRFSVEESSVMEGMVFLEKSLFTSYQYNLPAPPSPHSSTSETAGVESNNNPVFAVSLPSLLETLQIFGLTADTKSNPFARDSSTFSTHAFSNQVLGVSGLCRLGYDAPGAPLTIILEEQGIKTTCELNTYEPASGADIPFSRDQIVMKVIMRATYLFDAIDELSANNPSVITLAARKKTFSISAASPLGSAVVDFHRDARPTAHRTPAASRSYGNDDEDRGVLDADNPNSGLLETFLLATNDGSEAFSQSYKFAHLAATKKALQAATKVSVRADHQGVLSLQFMIENLEGGGVSFVDFRFVPLVEGDEEGERENGDTETESDEEEEDG